jgi:hypothetical protein
MLTLTNILQVQLPVLIAGSDCWKNMVKNSQHTAKIIHKNNSNHCKANS